MQQTSISAFEDLKEDEVLGTMQLKVLNCIRKHKIVTNKEISKFTNMSINSVTPRTNELVKAGIVTQIGIKKQQNGRKAMCWGVVL